MIKPKLCYVLPRYDERTDTHLNHIYQFLERVGMELDIFLFIEASTTKTLSIKNISRFYVQRFHFLPLRVLENVIVLLWIRTKGYLTFYIHYSFLSAFVASMIVRTIGGRTFYWNCGLPWLYKRSALRERFERLTYRLITFLVTGTESLARQYSEHYGIQAERIRVMPNWVDLERIRNKESEIRKDKVYARLGIAEDHKIILFVHRLSERKGADLLPDIMKTLGRDDVTLLIIGDGPERQNIKIRNTKYEIRDRVCLLGAIPNADIIAYYAIASALVMPSREEGFPRVLLEAMAACVPFVASDIGGVRDIIPPLMQEYVVRPEDNAGYASKLNELLSMSDKKRDEMKKELASWVERYDIGNVARIFIDTVRS